MNVLLMAYELPIKISKFMFVLLGNGYNILQYFHNLKVLTCALQHSFICLLNIYYSIDLT